MYPSFACWTSPDLVESASERQQLSFPVCCPRGTRELRSSFAPWSLQSVNSATRGVDVQVNAAPMGLLCLDMIQNRSKYVKIKNPWFHVAGYPEGLRCGCSRGETIQTYTPDMGEETSLRFVLKSKVLWRMMMRLLQSCSLGPGWRNTWVVNLRTWRGKCFVKCCTFPSSSAFFFFLLPEVLGILP